MTWKTWYFHKTRIKLCHEKYLLNQLKSNRRWIRSKTTEALLTLRCYYISRESFRLRTFSLDSPVVTWYFPVSTLDMTKYLSQKTWSLSGTNRTMTCSHLCKAYLYMVSNLLSSICTDTPGPSQLWSRFILRLPKWSLNGRWETSSIYYRGDVNIHWWHHTDVQSSKCKLYSKISV